MAVMTGLAMLALALAPAMAAGVEEDLVALERQMVELVNVERSARAIPLLSFDESLSKAARMYSERMAEQQSVGHDLDRPLEERILEIRPDTCLFGENVSKHTSIDYSIGDLMLSEGHRTNLLHRRYTRIGVGIVRGTDGYLYITQEFVRPCDPPRRRR